MTTEAEKMHMDVYVAAWFAMKDIVCTAVIKDGKLRFETPTTNKARTALELYKLRPRIDLHTYVDQLKRLSTEAGSLRKQKK